MRLSEIREIIEKNQKYLTISSESVSGNGALKSVKNIPDILSAIFYLNQIPSLRSSISKLKNIKDISSIGTSEAVVIKESSYYNFEKLLNVLNIECSAILSLVDSVLPKTDENVLCVKLSDDIDLERINILLENLDLAFNKTLILKNYKGSIKFSGVESGSNWINFIVSGTEYASIIVIFISLAYKVAEDFITLKILNQKYRSIIIQNDANEAASKLLKEMIEQEIQHLNAESSINVDQEELGKIILAVKTLSQVIIDGNKILLSLTAPTEQQKSLLESAKKLDSTLNELKLLNPASSDDTDNEPAGNNDSVE